MVDVKQITDKQIWEDFVLNYSGANFLQSWSWGEFHKNLDHKIIRSGFYNDNQLVGVMLSVVENAKRATYLTVPGGPLIDWNLSQDFANEIKRIALENDCGFVRVRPQVLDNSENRNMFTHLGFRSAPMHLHAELTHQLDLNKSEDELLINMRKATRYEIKQAQKLNIKITTSSNLEDIDAFYDLQMQTAKRQGFIPFSRKFLQEQFRVFVEDKQTILYTAKIGEIKLAQAMVIFYGEEADYHYGASSPEGRKYPGAYLIQWEAIKEAKHRNLLRYNFWGVAPEGETDHRFSGVSLFKRGFGGQDLAYLHAHDYVISWPKYILNWLVEEVRRRIRKV